MKDCLPNSSVRLFLIRKGWEIFEKTTTNYVPFSTCAILLFSGCSKSNETIATFKGGTLTVQDFYDNPKVKSNNQTLLKK